MKRRWILPIGVAFVAILAHIETVSYWFVTSDTLTLTVSSRATTLDGVVEVFTEPLMAGTRFTNVALFYRPIASLSYTLDYALWGLDPTGYHLTNLVLHGTAVALSALVVMTITDPETGLFTGLLVAIHPVTVEVVPAAPRRHSILMSVFLLAALLMLIRGRRRDSRRLFAGSVIAYALALLTKELSLLFPGLVFAWIVLDELEGGSRPTGSDVVHAVRTALPSLVPFLLASLAYVAVRVAVLGGLGGYDESRHLTPELAVEIVAKYVISLTYPQDIIAAAIRTAGRGPLLAFGGLLGAIALALIALAVRRPGRRAGTLALATVAAGVGGLPFVAVLVARFGVTVHIGFPTPHSIVLGGLFVASLAAGAFVALSALPSQRRSAETVRPLVFFAIWLAAPVPLFLLSSDYTIRNGYLFLTPAMGIVALVSTRAIRNADVDTRKPDADTALTVIAALFVLSLAVTSPLVHAYDGWQIAGQTNRATLTTLDDALVDAPDDATVQLSQLPQDVRTQRSSFPRVQSVSYAREGTVESWLRLRDRDNRMLITVSEFTTLPQPPTGARLATDRRNGTVRIDVRYTYP